MQVPVEFDGVPPHWNPPYMTEGTLRFPDPAIRLRYEKLLSDPVWVSGAWKDCQHYKLELSRKPETLGFRWFTRSFTDIGYYKGQGLTPWEFAYSGLPLVTFGQLGNSITGLPTLIQEDIGDGFVPRPTNLDVLIDASLKACLPTIKAELSLVNSVIELKDFRSLPHTLTKLRQFTSRLGNTIKRSVQLSGNLKRARRFFSLNSPTMSEALGVTADSYLQTQFNILPLFSDIMGITHAILRTRGRINDLLMRQGKRQKKHFTVRLPTSQAAETSVDINYGLHSGVFDQYFSVSDDYTGIYSKPFMSFECAREVIPDQFAEFHAQIEYNFWFTRFQTEHAQLLGMMDALGVNLNPAIIWNAIPWTFVVDWVADVSQWLGNRKTLNMEPAINISRYSWSWKNGRTVRLRLRAKNELDVNYPSTWTYLPDLRETVYRRSNEMPAESLFLTGSGLSSRELSLGVALAYLLGKRRKRVRTKS